METRKVLWTVLCVVIIFVVIFGIALALAFPRGTNAGAPASVAAVAPPRSPSPDEYVRAVQPAPVPAAPTAEPVPAPGSDIIVVYGEKPEASTMPAAGSTAAQPAPSSAVKPYAPATAAPSSTPTVKPAAAAAAKPSAATAKPAPKAVAVEEYWIQAAAFTSRTRADDLQRELATKGLSTLITVKDLDGVTMYRVRIGPYPTEREAKGWLEKVRAISGCGEAYVSRQTVSRSS